MEHSIINPVNIALTYLAVSYMINGYFDLRTRIEKRNQDIEAVLERTEQTLDSLRARIMR